MNARLALLICSALLALACPCLATGSAPALDMRVKDFTAAMNPSYTEELNCRLARYAEESGYDIYIALVANQNEFTALTAPLLRSRVLEKSWSKGFVVLSMGPYSRHAAILVSDSLRERFSHGNIVEEIEQIVEFGEKKYTTMDGAVEYAVDKIIGTIDPWFYVLPPPREFPRGFFHKESAEVILLGFAPLSAFMFAIALMAFTSAGGLGILKRLAVSGVCGLISAIAEAFLLRQPGGISLAGLYYSGIVGFTVAAAVGALKPIWFNDKFTGKKSNAWWSGPVHFHWG